jgi:hypothetical protein
LVSDHTAAQRRKALAKGHALPNPDGPPKFPIENAKDLANAIRLAGHVKAQSKASVQAFIRKRARQLGLSSRIPDTW